MKRSRFMVSPASVMAFLMRNVDLRRFSIRVTQDKKLHHFDVTDKVTQEVVFSVVWNTQERSRVTLPLAIVYQ